MPTSAMDWPMSRDEKKRQLVRLYNGDVQAADAMLSSGEKTLEALRDELDAVRQAAGVKKQALPDPTASPRTAATNAEVERLRVAVESAAAVLRAIVPAEDPEDAAGDDTPNSPTRVRARSEPFREIAPAGPPLRPALCRTPRTGGKLRRKVSFGSQPEEEPVRARNISDSEEDDEKCCDKEITLMSPPPRRKRDSLGIHREKVKGTEMPEPDAVDVPKPDASSSSGSRSGLKTHAAWLLGSTGFALLLAKTAYQLGAGSSTPPPASSSPTLFGDPTCWVHGFRPDYCCLGPGGNPSCWDKLHTYERCCIPKVPKREL